MSKSLQRIRGTQDIWGEPADRFQTVVEAFDRVRRLYAFQRIELPVFEATSIFARSIGETSDIVSKEMYSFEDRGGDGITLRPEFTAGIARAYLSEGWQQLAPLKIATHGPVFRYERPQKGRYRQFHQLDAEIIGTDSPSADVELLVLADQLLRMLGIDHGVTLEINTLGDDVSRAGWRDAVSAYFAAHSESLSADSKLRLDKNVLRILDSKDEGDRALVRDAPHVDAYLSAEARSFYEKVKAGLRAAGIAFVENPRLVRGLDYYSHTAFEFVTDRLGAQGAVIAGGRYDGLIPTLGGPATPAVGWAAGIERLGMLIDAPAPPRIDVALVPLGEKAETEALAIAATLRRAGIACDMAYRGNMKKRMQKASASGARFAIILGDEELARGQAALKDLASGSQSDIAIADLVDAVRGS
ncbi:histidine--tRNA ligase [Sphingosinicella rhizophila]|uniref:Histidine--tRNA ligase n=1 Tax=Sphingosinicella rhizophila TaxID=3050082 RepID=A0ABU3QBZ5_9SPHN|nr:histidine--tRNA ligase [Sphingosinicella sp. GR2756]MDT9600909.1 histidine--tRNA ligase [Sphingosinicella sp. GR2756]